MDMKLQTIAGIAFAAIGLSCAFQVHAESSIATGTGALSTSARLDFRITIPKVLFLQVGAGSPMAALGTVNLIDFVVPATGLGTGVAVAATAASGDLGTGAVTAKVVGNNGNVTLTATTAGPLGNGAGDTLSYSQVSTVASVLTSASALPAPVLADASTTSTTIVAVGKVVNRDARWTFSYLNTSVVPAGTFGGVNTQNGRVTYTASMP